MTDLPVEAVQIKILEELVRVAWKGLAVNQLPYAERRAAIKALQRFSFELHRHYFKTRRYASTSPEAMSYYVALAKFIQSKSS